VGAIIALIGMYNLVQQWIPERMMKWMPVVTTGLAAFLGQKRGQAVFFAIKKAACPLFSASLHVF
jgi:hypothetical protein